MEKNGKPIGNLITIKKDFFINNKLLLSDRERIAQVYKQQPLRERCKICGEELIDCKQFYSHNLLYKFCNNCNHLNGEFIDTDDFAQKLYIEDNYSKEYTEKDREKYLERTKEIYAKA